VHDRGAVLGSRGRLAEDLDSPEVGGDEGEPGDPRRQRPPGQKKSLLDLTARLSAKPIPITKTK